MTVQPIPVSDQGLGNTSYIVDLGDGGALVVDPARDPRPYLAELERRGLVPRWAVESHLHADFVSGGRELAALGAELLAPAGSDLAFPHRGLRDGEELDLGGLTLRPIATPGHTPEHLAYLLLDEGTPLGLFSGGTLIVGGAARPDLLSPELTEPLARAAYRSIRERLLTLSDDLSVYPTHGGWSFCSVATTGESSTTIGAERATNPLIADDPHEDTFVARLLGGLGSHPPYFLELRAVNRAGPPVYGSSGPGLETLSVEEVEAALAAGAELVDVRPVEAFAAGHIPGALSIPWRSSFPTWLGWLVDRSRPVVFVAESEVDRDDLVWAALRIGFEEILGELAGGIDGWVAAGQELDTVTLVDASAAADRRIVDVRQAHEFASGHAPGAVHMELGSLAEHPAAVPDDPLVVHCGRGERAMSAASLIRRAGHQDVAVFPGGPGDLRDEIQAGEVPVG